MCCTASTGTSQQTHIHTTYDTCATHEILSEAVLSSSSRLIDLSGAVRYEGVKFDSCLLQESEGAVLPDTQDLEPTLDPDPAHLSVATPTHLSALTPGAMTVMD